MPERSVRVRGLWKSPAMAPSRSQGLLWARVKRGGLLSPVPGTWSLTQWRQQRVHSPADQGGERLPDGRLGPDLPSPVPPTEHLSSSAFWAGGGGAH